MQLSREHPFPGLRPFDFDDAAYFFGRGSQISALFRHLDRSRFIAVIGSSGGGKSSLVRAGLLPLLQQEASEPGGRPWHWTTLTPGDAPIARLARALAALAQPVPGERPSAATIRTERIDAALRRSSFGIGEALGEMPNLGDAPILIVVDQFEELFRYAGSSQRNPLEDERWRNDAANFVQLLLEATRPRESRIYVLITMRSDFIGDCAQFFGLPEAVSATQFLVPALTRDQTGDVIREPIAHAGGAIEPDLVERLLNDSGNEIDALPVLQHCLLRLWETAPPEPEGRRVTLGLYNAVGRIGGALSQHANEVMATIPESIGAVERVFRALSERDKEGRATRRARSFAQLLAETGVAEAELRGVLDRFRADDCTFLLPSSSSEPELSSGTRVDVAHEALLRRWDKISGGDESAGRGWLASEEHDRDIYRGLLGLVESGNDGSATITLPTALVDDRWAWWEALRPTPAWADRYGGAYERVEKLLLDSRAELDRERARAAETAEREREFVARQAAAERERLESVAQMERVRADAAVRVAKTTRNYLVLAVTLFVLALGGLATGLINAQKAQAAKAALQTSIDNDRKLLDQQSLTYSMSSTTTERNLDLTIKAFSTVIALAPGDADAYLKRGLTYYQEGRYDLSIADFSRAISLESNNAVAFRDRGAAYLAQHVDDKAIADETSAIDLNPYLTPAYLDRGAALTDAKRYDEALADYNKAIELDPNYAPAYGNRGLFFERRGDYDSAIADFSKSIELDPNVAFVYKKRADAYEAKGQTDPADEAKLHQLSVAAAATGASAPVRRDRSADYDPGRSSVERPKVDAQLSSAYIDKGNALDSSGDYVGAIGSYDRAIQLHPSDAIAYYNRGVTRENHGNYRDALPDFDAALRLNPRYESAFEARAIAESDLGDYQHSLADHDAALRLNPRDEDAYNNRGNVYENVENYRLAIADYDRAKSLDPTDPYPYNNRGLAYYELDQFDRAIVDFAAAIKLKPSYAEAYRNRGLAYYEKDEYDLAIRDYDKAVALRPRYADAYRLRGLVHYQRGENDAAIADYGRALDIDPGLARAYSDRSDAYEAKGAYARSIADATHAIALNPGYAWSYKTRALSEDHEDRYDRAIADYEEAISLDPKQKSFYAAEGSTFANSGRYDSAFKDFSRALALDPKYESAYTDRGTAYFTEGDTAHAVADFGRAIALDGTDPWPHLVTGIADYYSGANNEARRQFARALGLRPHYAYNALWLELADRKGHVPSSLAAEAKEIDAKAWPAPIVQLFLGHLNSAALFAAARNPDPIRTREQTCEANFYSAELLRLSGARADLAPRYVTAARDCPHNFMEWGAAREALRTLGMTPP